MTRTTFAPIGIAAIALLGLTACDDTADTNGADTEENGTEATTEETTEEEVDPAEDEEPEEEEDAEAGTRDNPYPLGETFTGVDWEVTVIGIDYDAEQAVADANMFNEPAPEGSQFILVDASATYTGDESEMVMMGVDFAFVTDTGETHTASDTMEVAPEALDISAELYTGGTESGNVLIAIPEDATGLIRVNTGFIDQQAAFFESE